MNDVSYLDMQSSANPFANMNVGQDAANAVNMTQQYQGNIASMQSQFDKVAADAKAYPTFANSYGIGSQSPFGTAAPAPSSTNKDGQTNPVMTDANHGFNPWSLVGEANTR